MVLISSKTFLRSFGQKFDLEFDLDFHYYIGNAYKDSKGEYLKSYYFFRGNVFELKYLDGCFNPYLNMLDKKNFGLIFKEKTVTVEEVVKVNTINMRDYYYEKFGERFSML